MLETSARLLRLLSLFQARRDWTGAELAARLGVTTRTVRNDVARLRELGYPVDARQGVAGGGRLRTRRGPPPVLGGHEQAGRGAGRWSAPPRGGAIAAGRATRGGAVGRWGRSCR